MQNQIIVNEPFRALGDKTSIFVGRKTSVYKKHGTKAAMDIGVVAEESGADYKNVLMDSISPHAVFICGMRGSGKSYTLGVIAEELALKNDAVGAIVIDPMGIFWSMKHPNKVEREQDLLQEWALTPTGVKTLHVFIPAGYARDAPKKTWDGIFTIRPSELTADDWCLTFGFDRFDTMGLLIDRVIEKVKEGYTTVEGNGVDGIQDMYGISDMIACIETEEGIHSRSQGFKNSTRRALVARLKGAVEWGIFDKKGTKLRDLSRRGQISVIDVSFLQDNVRALVVGILAKNILNTRKRTSRKEAVGISGLFESIPVTWLMIDEAHILVPGSGRKTAATDALIEYVRQGRQPGCSIVLATQQPSAIDSRILSQVDMMVCHKLVYEDDIKAVLRRMPSEMPEKFQEDRFIKSLPVGMAIIGDKQEETSRSFLVCIRPRISQHEGRERQPILEVDPLVMRENVEQLIQEKWGKVTIDELEKMIKSINEEYKLNFSFSEIVDELIEKGVIEEELKEPVDKPKQKPVDKPKPKPVDKPKQELQPESVPVQSAEPLSARSVAVTVEPALPAVHPSQGISEPQSIKDVQLTKTKVVVSAVDNTIQEIAKKRAKKVFFKKDTLYGIFKIYYPLYQVSFDFYPPKGKYQSLSCFIDGITGEIILEKGKRTRGVRDLIDLSPDQRSVMTCIMKKKTVLQTDVIKATHFDNRKVKRIINALIQKGLLYVKKHKKFETKKFEVFKPTIDYTIVEDPRKKVATFFETDEEFVDTDLLIPPVLKKKEAKKAVEIWNKSVVWDTVLLHYPYFVVSYETNYVLIDGVTGRKDDYAKSMLSFRL